MGRKILFISTDQQGYDALGCNGGTIALGADRYDHLPPPRAPQLKVDAAA